MTEAEWLGCDDPGLMLERARFKPSRRKNRLFAVACCRLIWSQLLDPRSRTAIEVAERHVEGAATDEALQAAADAAHKAHREMFGAVGKAGSCLEWAAAYAADVTPFLAAKSVAWMAAVPRSYEVSTARADEWIESIQLVPCEVTRRKGPFSLVLGKWKVTTLATATATGAENDIQTRLIRCIFGYPFRPIAVDPLWLAWNGGAVRMLAQGIYEERAFDRLPILIDALEEAGCTDTAILDHCRGPGPHVRGCWVLDLILGKE